MLYSSVGHAGASGYLASMALVGSLPATMKPTALILNILVSMIATSRFYAAGCFSWRILLPFIVLSVPFAYLGGSLQLPSPIYKQLVGAILLFAAFRMYRERRTEIATRKDIPWLPALAAGAGIGLLSGLTGTGGGIFLSPLLLLMGWAETKKSAGVSAAFIMVNSVAGLIGFWGKSPSLPDGIGLLAVAAVGGGLIGSELGSRRVGNSTLRILLAVVLVIAGLKMILS